MRVVGVDRWLSITLIACTGLVACTREAAKSAAPSTAPAPTAPGSDVARPPTAERADEQPVAAGRELTGGGCEVIGSQVVSGKYGRGPGDFGRGRDGATEYAASAIMLSADEATLYVLDPGRVLAYSLKDGKAVRQSETVLHGWAPETAIPLPSGRYAAYEVYRQTLRTHDEEGAVVSKTQVGISASGPPELGSPGSLPVLFRADSGTWITDGSRLTHLYTPEGKRVEKPERVPGAMLSHGLTVRIVQGRDPRDQKTRRLVVAVGPKGRAPEKHVVVQFDSPVVTWLPPEVGPDGTIFLVTGHDWEQDGWSYASSLTKLTLLSPELQVRQRLALPPHPGDLPRSRPIAVARDGSFYHLATNLDGVTVGHYLPNAEGVFDCAPQKVLQAPPIDWRDASSSKLENADALGCRAQRSKGWLRLSCKEQGYPGPVYDFSVHAGGDPRQIVTEVASGDRATRRAAGHVAYRKAPGAERHVEFLTPFVQGSHIEAGMSWARAYRKLELSWPSQKPAPASLGTFTPAIPPGALSGCRYMARDLSGMLEHHGLTQRERAAFPKELNSCQQGGNGAWVVSAESVSRKKCENAQCLQVGFVVSALDYSGERSMMGQTPLTFTPGQLSLKQGSVDFDGDGQKDFFVVLAVKQGPGAPGLSQLWTLDGHAKLMKGAPKWFFHDARRVDGDDLPDLLTHGPFRKQLTQRCGVKDCPSELIGPELLAHNVGDGFSFKDSAARAHLERSCASTMGSALERLAKSVVCRRLMGEPVQAIRADVQGERAKLCALKKQCPALDIIDAWAKQPLIEEMRFFAKD